MPSAFAIVAALAFAGGEFEPCHVLCSDEAGRVEARATGTDTGFDRFRVRLEVDAVGVLGRYDVGAYTPLPDDAAVAVVQAIPVVSVRPLPWLVGHVGLPVEVNYSDGVVLPALHETPGARTMVEPGALFFSAQARVTDGVAASWAGLGYRLSKKAGTVDVADVLDAHPEAGTEALGIGSDDVYVTWRTALSLDPWEVGAGVEGRVHMLPRFTSVLGYTGAWRVWASRTVGRVTPSLALSGFVTRIPDVDVSQASLLLVHPGAWVRVSRTVGLAGGVTAEVPGAALNTNVLQTITGTVATDVSF